MNKYKMVIGVRDCDWSDDGHGKCEEYVFLTNATADEIRAGYKSAVTASKVSLHHVGCLSRETQDSFKEPEGTIPILERYESGTIKEEPLQRLKKLGIDFKDFEEPEYDDEQPCTPDDVADLFLQMVKTQIPGFTYEVVEDKVEPINGYWGKLNIQIGYGVF